MIILFTLLGLLGLGGGVWSIVDGLPYLVLERGFTQVIVGTVLATGGVVLLALACVLAELKRARKALSNAMMAASIASMAGERSDPPILAPVAAAGDRSDAAIAAGAGAAAAVGAALAAGASRDKPDPQEPSQADIGDRNEDDLFASPPDRLDMPAQAVHAGDAAATDPADEHEPAALPEVAPGPANDENVWSVAPIDEPVAPAPAEAEPRPDIEDPFADAIRGAVSADPFEPMVVPAASGDADDTAERDDTSRPDDDQTSRDETEAAPPALDPAARIEPTLVWRSEPEPEASPEQARREPAMPDVAASGDEFSFLRESLSGRALQREEAPLQDTPLQGTSLQDAALQDRQEGGSGTVADSWMDPQSGRHEPWFGERDARSADEAPSPQHETPPEPEPGDLTLPPWPPVTRQPEPIDERFDDEIGQDEIGDAPQFATETAGEPETETAASADPDPVEEPSPAADEPAPPAASDEGVVGAYQVGDAQFTIYADGSIQARTPDGDYTFGSMEELKTYLASEKSRLGA